MSTSQGSSLLIQAVHGHAWPEIYFRDIGWVIVDPAPQQTLVDMTTDPQNNLQQLLGDMLRNDASFDDFLQSQQTSAINLQLILNVLYGLILATLLSAYTVKFYRSWIPSRAATDKQYRPILLVCRRSGWNPTCLLYTSPRLREYP